MVRKDTRVVVSTAVLMVMVCLDEAFVSVWPRPPTTRIKVAAQKQAFYDYLANDWSVSSGELPWASSGFSFADLLPASSIEAQAIQVLEDKVPNWRNGFLTPDNELGVRRRFRVLAEAAGGEEAGLEALRRNVGILCVGERVMQAASQALQKGLGVEKAHEVVRKNPGVLAIRASSLEGFGLQRTVVAANIIDFFCGPAGFILELFKLLAVASVFKIVYDVLFLPNGLIRAVPN